MNINDLTIGQAKELANLFGAESQPVTSGLNGMVGKKVIIRTYSAGCWFGFLSEKSGNEVILTNARRMWKWWTNGGISLSCVAKNGINKDKSKIVEAVSEVWLESIEIIPCTEIAIESIEGAENAKAE